MTRLKPNDINKVSKGLQKYDDLLKRKYGHTLEDIAKKAVNIKENTLPLRTAVIPVTSGLGLITGFSQTVCHILKYCGVDVFVTETSDVAGVLEAYEKQVDLIFMADDDVCAAFSLNGKISSDNGYATGIGFAAALEVMMSKQLVEDQKIEPEVLILGAGPVGRSAANYMISVGMNSVISDLNYECAYEASKAIKGLKVAKEPIDFKAYRYILDGTSTGGFIGEEGVTNQTLISAPGMPLGPTEAAMGKAKVFHNPLELGIMTMYYDCMKKWMEGL